MAKVSIDPGISFISAGFPSPAEDFTELSISLDKHLIQNPAATFMAYANGNSMLHAGIHHGDILIIDRSLNARDGDIIIAVLYGEFTVNSPCSTAMIISPSLTLSDLSIMRISP